jgi:uncharacterized protein YqhQ
MSETPQRPYVGGQAVIEGVMMRSPNSFVVSVRRPNGHIAVRAQQWNSFLPSLKFLRWPVFRGAVVLAESLHNGYSALQFSADESVHTEGSSDSPKSASISAGTLLSFLMQSVVAGADAPGPASNPNGAQKGFFADSLLAMATAVMVLFFIALPHVLTFAVGKLFGDAFDTTSVWFHVVDGFMRVLVLVGYILVISKTKDAKILFQYHGAEHKSIWTYESDKALQVDNARPFTTKHPRCGTSFLFIVVGVSIVLHLLLLPFVPKLHDNVIINQLLMILIKVPMAFPIAGIAFELQRWSAKPSCPRAITLMTRPGMWLQSVTTQPPADHQLEVALLSLQRSLQVESGAQGHRGRQRDVYESFADAMESPAKA